MRLLNSAFLTVAAAWQHTSRLTRPAQAISTTKTSTFHRSGAFPRPLFAVSDQSDESALPPPEVGDIVTFPGKWPGESAVGRISRLQCIDARSEWIADVVVFKDIETGVFREDKRMRNSDNFPVSDLKPVQASYVRSSDGWKVPIDEDGKTVMASSPGFYVAPDFSLPVVEVDPVKVLEYEQAYEELKLRLLKETLLFGAFGTVATVALAGSANGATFGVGVGFGAAYVLLLERNTDQVGRKQGSTKGVVLSSLRFGLPLVLLGGISLERWLTGAQDQSLFNLVPKDQFVAAVGGFLSYRVPLLFTEIKNSLSGGLGEQVGELLPGSLGKSVALANSFRRAQDDLSGPLDSQICRVLLVSGPRGTGKEKLVQRLLDQNPPSSSSSFSSSTKKTLTVVPPPVATTRPARSGEEALTTDSEGGGGGGGDAATALQPFVFLDRLTFEQQKREGAVIATFDSGAGGADNSRELGEGELFGLRLDDILNAGSNGRVCVVDAPSTAFADKVALALEKRADVRLAGAWVSLNTMEDFEDRLGSAANGAPSGDDSEAAADGGGEKMLRESLKGVIADIEWGVLSGLFDFTVINDDPTRALTELTQAAAFLARDGEFEGAEDLAAARPPGV